MEYLNKVFIATSLDGYIADENGGIEWLDMIPEINTIDSGYADFMSEIDALIMGKSTFLKVLSFDIEWPYTKPVFVVSRSLKELPDELEGKVFLVKGLLTDILNEIHNLGFKRLYIDGGQLIQSFLREDLIDSMIITIIPVLLGSGISLFGGLDEPLEFKCIRTNHYINAIAQNHYERRRQ